MNITFTNSSNIKLLKPGDSNFLIKDEFIIAPRAGFEIDERCPQQYMSIIVSCINKGWLRPVAHITEKELLFLGLSKN